MIFVFKKERNVHINEDNWEEREDENEAKARVKADTCRAAGLGGGVRHV